MPAGSKVGLELGEDRDIRSGKAVNRLPIVSDGEDRVTLMNPAAERLFGVRYTDAERAQMLGNIDAQVAASVRRRAVALGNALRAGAGGYLGAVTGIRFGARLIRPLVVVISISSPASQPCGTCGGGVSGGDLPSAGGAGVQGAVLDDDITLKIARLVNEIADLEYESQQPVPYKLTAEEDALYYNEGKAHSARVAALEAHRGKAFSLIMGQCTQLLLDKMKQEKTWDVVSASYDPLELYKLIESVVLKQTEDQYPVAAMWDQYRQVFNAQQGNLSNT